MDVYVRVPHNNKESTAGIARTPIRAREVADR